MFPRFHDCVCEQKVWLRQCADMQADLSLYFSPHTVRYCCTLAVLSFVRQDSSNMISVTWSVLLLYTALFQIQYCQDIISLDKSLVSIYKFNSCYIIAQEHDFSIIHCHMYKISSTMINILITNYNNNDKHVTTQTYQLQQSISNCEKNTFWLFLWMFQRWPADELKLRVK